MSCYRVSATLCPDLWQRHTVAMVFFLFGKRALFD